MLSLKPRGTDAGGAALPGSASVPFVGLTGGIGAGKSTALEALARLGALTLSTDLVVHGLYEQQNVVEQIIARWGDEVAPSGTVDRAAIARVVFEDPAEREWLESLIWPLVGSEVASFRKLAGSHTPRPPAAVVETPLLFEAGMEAIYDATIAVVVDEELRRNRAAARGHVAADQRHSRQLSQQEKAERATYVVVNDGSAADLERELALILTLLER